MSEDDKIGLLIAAFIFAIMAGPFMLGLLIGGLR